MSYPHLMNATAFALGLLGLSFVLVESWMMAFFRATFKKSPGPQLVLGSEDEVGGALVGGIAMMRMFGVVLCGLSLYACISRHLVSLEARQNVVLGFFVVNSLAFLMNWFHQRTTWGVWAGRKRMICRRIVVAVFLGLTLAFGEAWWRRSSL